MQAGFWACLICTGRIRCLSTSLSLLSSSPPELRTPMEALLMHEGPPPCAAGRLSHRHSRKSIPHVQLRDPLPNACHPWLASSHPQGVRYIVSDLDAQEGASAVA